MGTINAAFYLITGALEADQSALDVVANNVANANTPGYTRQVPNWRENVPVEIAGVSYGSGVSQTGSTSIRDRVLEERISQQKQAQSESCSTLRKISCLPASTRVQRLASRCRSIRGSKVHYAMFCSTRFQNQQSGIVDCLTPRRSPVCAINFSQAPLTGHNPGC